MAEPVDRRSKSTCRTEIYLDKRAESQFDHAAEPFGAAGPGHGKESGEGCYGKGRELEPVVSGF